MPSRSTLVLALLAAMVGGIGPAEAHESRPAAHVAPDADALFNAGREAVEAGTPDQAIAFFRRALAAAPDKPAALVELGVALADLGEYDHARQAFERALRLGADAAALNGLGYVHYRQARLDAAIGCYRQALGIREDPQYHLNLGLAYLAQSRWGQAEDEFRLALAGQPDDFWAHNNLGYALQLQGRLDEAVEVYEAAMAFAGKDLTAHGNLGALLAGAQAWQEAAWVYGDALKRDDGAADAHVGLANALSQLGRLDEAILELRVAMRLKPATASVRHLMAELYRHREELAAARREAELAVAEEPSAPAYQLTLGQVLLALDKPDEAVRVFERYLRLAPPSAEADKVRRWLDGRRKRRTAARKPRAL